MSKPSYKAWLQNNGFTQSFEDDRIFVLTNQDNMGQLDTAWDKAEKEGIRVTKGNYDGEYGIRILGVA